MSLRASISLWFAVAGALAGCAADPGELTLASPDHMVFETEVYPVLLRDCGFHACHGSSQRFFQVFGPGRGRLLPGTQPLAEPTPEEIEHTYARALSMINAKHPDRSLLLIKPLASAAGGAGHQGVDSLGRNVYAVKTEPGYATLSAWVKATASLAPAAPAAPGPAAP